MSSRALRKALRVREGKDRLEAHNENADDGAGSSNDEAIIQPRKSAFAMLDQDHDDDHDDEGDDNDVDQHVETEDDDAIKPSDTAVSSSKKKPNKKKKRKSKRAQAADSSTRSDQLDEIDAALQALSPNGRSAQNGNDVAQHNAKDDEAFRLLAVDREHLNAQNEMRKLFGRAALDRNEDDADHGRDEAVGGNRRHQRRLQHAGLAQALRGQRAQGGRPNGNSQLGLRRNLFIQGKEEWPAATGGGLGMEVVEKHADGVVEYRYVHSRMYQDVQAQFDVCVESMDPNRMVVLLQHNPFHISTLLQVSEIAKSERDHTTSGDLLERALFSLGRAVHSTFAKNLADGKARLDFRRPENRELWLASWRYMQNLSMRGTWRTVYEWAKLLLALSPVDDPYALWLVLDQYALRSKQDLDYINLSRNSILGAAVKSLPNVQLSQGLAEYRSGNKSRGQQSLYTAISQYPWFVARLMQELDLDAPPAIWGKTARTEKEKLYAELYSTRAKDIWNTPEHSALLLEMASAVPPEAKAAPSLEEAIHLNEARHVVLADIPALIALVPRKFTSNLDSVSDPLPPEESIVSYQTSSTQSRFQAHRPARDGNSGLYNLFEALLPRFGRRNRAGEDELEREAEDEDDEDEQNIDEAVMRRILRSGLDPGEVMQRLIELQDTGEGDGRGAGLPDAEILERLQHQLQIAEELEHQPRIEDASEEE